MLILIKKNITNNIMYTVIELHIFYNHLELNYKSFYLSATPLDVIPSHQYFHHILRLIYQPSIFYTYSFYNINILQHHMIYHIHILSYLDSK